ncbi:MAG: prephenate dehydrogenase/arogenate dehydrogenase family protein [Ruminococcaceae bacterium]|nr:prephenate dehydrogenase/arogenate dehydrogenase family protein [Oscillospiraceae bacterium]
MTVGIVGLGLIGGSFARAFKEFTDYTVLGRDISSKAFYAAKLVDAIDGELTEKNIGECDLILVSLYPEKTVEFIEENAAEFKKGALVIDCCGVKRYVCERLLPVAEKNGFVFLGGHPMAGTQNWGFEYSRSSMFKNASMIITCFEKLDITELERIKKIFLEVGFARIQFSTPEEHDRIIALTSQLAHVVSNAYVKSPTAKKRMGFSAGSYRDMTRVADLNDEMWTELFLENRDYLSEEIDTLVKNLKKYSKALKDNDAKALQALLIEGKENKREDR